MSPVAAALDIGGTKIAAATVTAEGEVGARHWRPTPAGKGPERILGTAADLVREAVGDLDTVGVGVGSAGVVDPATGRVRSATDALPGWAGTDLRGGLADALGRPVTVANDVHAHALGEYWRGAARGRPTALVLAVGTGVGAAQIGRA
ncbi:ROK family protein, partial [Nocardiopsis nanhaiensis]